MQNIAITSKDIPVTDSMRERIEARLSRLERLHIPLINPNVIITPLPKGFAIEARVEIPHGTLFAQAEHENLYTAITEMGQKLERQLNRYAHKAHSHRGVRSGKEQCRAGVISGEPEHNEILAEEEAVA